MLEVHKYTIYQETLEAFSLVNDEINQVGGMFDFNIYMFLSRWSETMIG